MQIATVGIDLAKNVFQVHGANEHGKAALRKQLRREQVTAFFANVPAGLMGMKACGSSHMCSPTSGTGPHGSIDGAALGEAVCEKQQKGCC